MSNIILLEESLPSIRLLSDAEAGALLKALILHLGGEEPTDLPEKAVLLYPFVMGQMDRMNAISARRSAAGRIGGSKTQANFKQTSSKSEANVKQNESKREAPIPIPIPTKEKESKKKEKVDLPDSGIWADQNVRDAFTEYAKMRIRIKKSLTPEAVKRKIPKLEAMTSDPAKAVEIIHEATDNCWLDFYETRKPPEKKTFNFTERKTDYDSLLNAMGV